MEYARETVVVDDKDLDSNGGLEQEQRVTRRQNGSWCTFHGFCDTTWYLLVDFPRLRRGVCIGPDHFPCRVFSPPQGQYKGGLASWPKTLLVPSTPALLHHHHVGKYLATQTNYMHLKFNIHFRNFSCNFFQIKKSIFRLISKSQSVDQSLRIKLACYFEIN